MLAAPRTPLQTASRGWAWLGALVALALLFCAHAFANASDFDSDTAVVGLQARHLLRGEWSWSLWGAGYQSGLDALPVALGFSLFGARPLAMMAATFSGQLIAIALAFRILAPRLGPRAAAVCALPLVVAPAIVTNVALFPPRQWAITCVFFSLWLLEKSDAPGTSPKRARARLAGGSAAFFFSLHLDLFTLQLLPAFALFAFLLCARGARARARVVALAGGAALGAIPLALSRLFDPLGRSGSFAPAGISLAVLPRNWSLLFRECLPLALSYRWPGELGRAAELVHPLLFASALLFAGAVLFSAGFALRAEPAVQRLGALGATAMASTLAAFLVSRAVSDVHTARYLAPLSWMAPFALAPLARRVRARTLLLLLAPALCGTALLAWLPALTARDRVPGSLRTERGAAVREHALGDFLRARHIQYAGAQYWLAYKMTLLFEENPIVVPLDPAQDRYRPFLDAFIAAPEIALIFDPGEPRAQPAPFVEALEEARVAYERITVAGYTVLLVHKRARG